MPSSPQPRYDDVAHPSWCSPETCRVSSNEVHHRDAGELFMPADQAEEEHALELTRWRVDYRDEHGQHPTPTAVEIAKAWSADLMVAVTADDVPRLTALLLAKTRCEG